MGAQSALQDVIHDRDRLAEQLESVEALPSGVLDERLTRLEACSGHSTTGSASSFLLAAGLAGTPSMGSLPQTAGRLHPQCPGFDDAGSYNGGCDHQQLAISCKRPLER